MTNIEKLVDFINERDTDGKLFERFVAFLQLGLLAQPDNTAMAGDEMQEA